MNIPKLLLALALSLSTIFLFGQLPHAKKSKTQPQQYKNRKIDTLKKEEKRFNPEDRFVTASTEKKTATAKPKG
jgi:hypothetical protein